MNDLALALFVGMLVGTYSSIFVATPILCQIKERQPENIALAKRVKARRSKGADDLSVAAVAAPGAPIVTAAGPRQQQVKKTRARRTKR